MTTLYVRQSDDDFIFEWKTADGVVSHDTYPAYMNTNGLVKWIVNGKEVKFRRQNGEFYIMKSRFGASHADRTTWELFRQHPPTHVDTERLWKVERKVTLSPNGWTITTWENKEGKLHRYHQPAKIIDGHKNGVVEEHWFLGFRYKDKSVKSDGTNEYAYWNSPYSSTTISKEQYDKLLPPSINPSIKPKKVFGSLESIEPPKPAALETTIISDDDNLVIESIKAKTVTGKIEHLERLVGVMKRKREEGEELLLQTTKRRSGRLGVGEEELGHLNHNNLYKVLYALNAENIDDKEKVLLIKDTLSSTN